MNSSLPQLSNAFSTGGGGAHFENHVQALFVTLMLTDGCVPTLPGHCIQKIKLQGKVDGYSTDDMIVFTKSRGINPDRKILGQIKHRIAVTEGDKEFAKTLLGMWSDYTNSKNFTKEQDRLALLTGPISRTDWDNVQWLLHQAKCQYCAADFLRYVDTAKFRPPKSKEKLDVFRYHLTNAKGSAICDDELYAFLKHFYWFGFDLGEEAGVVRTLLESHISVFNPDFSNWLFSRICVFVASWNQHAGTITQYCVPEDIRDAFMQRTTTIVAPEYAAKKQPAINWNQYEHAALIAVVNLIGQWNANPPQDLSALLTGKKNEDSSGDISILNTIIEEDQSSWLPKLRKILHSPDSPLSFKNGIWCIEDRMDLWSLLGSHLFDEHLERFRQEAIKVLREPNPAFDLEHDKRWAANLFGKKTAFSPQIRRGIATGLALLGCRSNVLSNCSAGKAEGIASIVIREILFNADWVLWGSLQDVLPALADAAPLTFLEAVEQALRMPVCPFDNLYAQESQGITGQNYMIGLLWALESLAWDADYLSRICLILGHLASRDPGGNWSNRPKNSLTTILLPWLPQTLAPIAKRQAAVKALVKECPEVAWKLLISLLPGKTFTTSHSFKPKYRNVMPSDWNEDNRPSREDYQTQIDIYSLCAVELADADPVKLAELIENVGNLSTDAFGKLIEVLSSDRLAAISEEDRCLLWENMRKQVSRHRRFSGADWAMPEESLLRIEEEIERFEPSNLSIHYRLLFSYRAYECWKIDDDEFSDSSINRRKQAVEAILQQGDVDAVIQFAEMVEQPNWVGNALAEIQDGSFDNDFLPNFLTVENTAQHNFIAGYIWTRFRHSGLSWCDELNQSQWNEQQIVRFFHCLPVTNEVWRRIEQLTPEIQTAYWEKIFLRPFFDDECDVNYAVQRLLDVGRPFAALACLDRRVLQNKAIDTALTIKVLYASLHSSEPPQTLDINMVLDLIQMLQNTGECSDDDLFQLEWAYLPAFSQRSELSPKTLQNRLANDPEFFCQLIQMMFRSQKEESNIEEPAKDQEQIASQAYQLLEEWPITPGMQTDGSFNKNIFTSWLKKVKESCQESGHLEIALIKIGNMLVTAPADPEGLWLDRTIADALNEMDNGPMRSGFENGLYNSRGAHLVYPSGEPEVELAKNYRGKAEDIENAGFPRLATTLRILADNYDTQAKRIIDEHKIEHKQ